MKRVMKALSLRKWIRYYWILMMMLMLGVFFVSQFYIRNNLTQDKERELNSVVQVSGYHIDKSLEVIDSFIYETFVGSNDLFTLNHGSDAAEVFWAKEKIRQSMSSIWAWSGALDAIVFYAPLSPDQTLIEVGGNASFALRRALKGWLSDNIGGTIPDNLLNTNGYMSFDVEGTSYILRMLKVDDCYFVSCISEDTFLESLKSIQDGMDSMLFIADESGAIITDNKELLRMIHAEDQGNYIEVGNKSYLQVGFTSVRSGFYFGILTSRDYIMYQVRSFQIAFIILSGILLIFFPLTVTFVQVFLEKPLSGLVEGMKKVGRGEWNTIIKINTPVKEYDELTDSFNHMVGEIENLKIQNYESEIRSQKANLQYLQLQIKPHFYVNALNIIYSLAQTHDFAMIQKLSSALVGYIRYMFHDATILVPLSKELEHVKNYVEIQKIRYSDQICYVEDVETDVFKCLVPPFIIQSFVENSIKYAFTRRERMEVIIRGFREDSYLHLEIRDNGVGYSEELLTDFVQKDGENNGGRVGLTNVRERMRLIYGEDADMEILNDGGAVTRIRIPLIGTDGIPE